MRLTAIAAATSAPTIVQNVSQPLTTCNRAILKELGSQLLSGQLVAIYQRSVKRLIDANHIQTLAPKS
jgi:hypothetical protein